MVTKKTFSWLLFFLEITQRVFVFFFVLSVLNLGKILIFYSEYHLQTLHYLVVFLRSLFFLLACNFLKVHMHAAEEKT